MCPEHTTVSRERRLRRRNAGGGCPQVADAWPGVPRGRYQCPGTLTPEARSGVLGTWERSFG